MVLGVIPCSLLYSSWIFLLRFVSVRETISITKQEDIGVEYKLEKKEDIKETISKITDEMLQFASQMEFEKAAELRDKIKELEKLLYQ